MNKLTTISIVVALGLGMSSVASAEVYTVGTNPQGSLFYSMGTALAKVMVDKTDKQYRVSPYAGSSTFIPMLNTGRLAFGFANGGEATFAHQGKGNFKRANPNLRLVGVAIATQTSFAVPTDSPAKTVEDLKTRIDDDESLQGEGAQVILIHDQSDIHEEVCALIDYFIQKNFTFLDFASNT